MCTLFSICGARVEGDGCQVGNQLSHGAERRVVAGIKSRLHVVTCYVSVQVNYFYFLFREVSVGCHYA